MRLQESIQVIKDRWISISKRQKISVASLVFLMLALPLSVAAVLTQQYLGSRASIPVTPPITPPTTLPTPMFPYNKVIMDTFDGSGALNPTKWNWSGTIGSAVVLENNQIKLSVPAGNDSSGGNDVVTQALIDSQIPTITGNFDVSVDLVGVTTDSGWQELKFAPAGAISVRRNKVGSTETLEVWTSQNNVPSDYIKNVSKSLPSGGGPIKIKLVRMGSEILVYYFDQNTFVNILDIEYTPVSGDGTLPRLVVENNVPNYPVTVGYFDNYLAYFNLKNTATPPPTATPQTLPDLAIIEPITVKPNPATITDAVLVSFKMVNIGTSVAYPAVYSYTDQADGFSSIHSSNTCNGSTSLKPGGSCVSAYTFVFKTNGTKTLKISLDRSNILQESNENNNDYTVSVVIGTQTPSPIPTITPVPSIQPTSTPKPLPRVCRFKIFKKCLIWTR